MLTELSVEWRLVSFRVEQAFCLLTQFRSERKCHAESHRAQAYYIIDQHIVFLLLPDI